MVEAYEATLSKWIVDSTHSRGSSAPFESALKLTLGFWASMQIHIRIPAERVWYAHAPDPFSLGKGSTP